MKKLYEEASVQDIADAIREKTGGAETYRIAQMGAAVRSIPDGDQIAHADIPDYVKDGVLTLAQKVQAVKTASSIVFVTVADAHHATDESTGWKANIDTGNMDACRAIKALSHVTPLDFAAFLGDSGTRRPRRRSSRRSARNFIAGSRRACAASRSSGRPETTTRANTSQPRPEASQICMARR